MILQSVNKQTNKQTAANLTALLASKHHKQHLYTELRFMLNVNTGYVSESGDFATLFVLVFFIC
jgi:hypothetical protein